MTPTRSFLPTALGFAFVAVAFSQSLWIALLCLLGAGAFHVGHGLLTGTLSLAELQERAEAARSGFADPSRGSGGTPGRRVT
ncbi:hypothetical protein [Patulibacter minatonensis]|uniref:hypothetical protein n=1 Tax=Patulibacter minatonensis TaxID=298163 RepID=UPI0004790216|nr:hypothetical protein [Patulibacter minatonensis]